MSNSLQSHGLYILWNSPGQNAGVGSHSLLQEIFPIQESNWGLLHWGRFFTSWAANLENSMDCIVHGITKSWTWLSDFTFTMEMISGLLKVQVLFSSSTGATLNNQILSKRKKKIPVKEEFCSFNDSQNITIKNHSWKCDPAPSSVTLWQRKIAWWELQEWVQILWVNYVITNSAPEFIQPANKPKTPKRANRYGAVLSNLIRMTRNCMIPVYLKYHQ